MAKLDKKTTIGGFEPYHKGNDGPGSGMNADKLRGKTDDDFLDKNTYDADKDGVVDLANEANKANNADKLDGKQASDFVNKYGGNINGVLSFSDKFSIRHSDNCLDIMFNTGFTPQHVDGLTAWYVADSLTGSENGDRLYTWDDLSGNGLHATQSVNSIQPFYVTDQQNGLPVVSFTADDYFTADNLIDDISNTTIFIVNRPLDVSTVIMSIGSRESWGGSFEVVDTYAVSTRGGLVKWTPLATRTVFQVICVEITTNSLNSVTAYRNGSLLTMTSITDQSLNITGDMVIGGLTNNVGNPQPQFVGDIGEIVIYNESLTTEQKNSMNNYLTTKWGI